MSQINNESDNFILKHVKAVDQNKFESDILSKVDKAYKDHVSEERGVLTTKLSEVTDRIKVLSKSVKELNDCLTLNLTTSNCSVEEFKKIQNSLQNQINLKQQELVKLNRLEVRYRNQLNSLEVSSRLDSVIDEAGRNKSLGKGHSYTVKKDIVRIANRTSATVDREDGNESDSSASSAKTMIYEPSQEQLEYIEPFIKRRKIAHEFNDEDGELKGTTVRRRIKTDKVNDDGNYEKFRERVLEYKNQTEIEESRKTIKIDDEIDNDANVKDNDLGNGFQVPSDIWDKLYEYQRAGVQWLLNLHRTGVGGILGDEMGLGKTIQIIAFLAGLYHSSSDHQSEYQLGPVLIVCPATVMRQWMEEFRVWTPLFRVALLHSTGSEYNKRERMVKSIVGHPGVLVTTYSSMVMHMDLLIKHSWQYIVLDEGHKIKNPNAKVTICIKKFVTPHRLLLSGSPIQNNLKELWSLVDFVYPGKLGSLATFIQNFAVPILKGGYDHATPLQVETAYRCACVIRDTINEYLLRRTKNEVELQLPRKTEQVLFCGLSDHQRIVYREYLSSRQCKQILAGQQVPFPGLVMVRKICNHPDLVTGGPKHIMDHPILGFSREESEDRLGHTFGHYSRSGKMVVMRELLQMWFRGKHKVLLFTQGKMMLQILKRFLDHHHYPYCSMDGTTPISSRHAIVNKFNESPYDEIFVFLLTTRVGGLGLNLVGADRVLLFDPDWNPCTDLQARERAWRIGQNRKVVIYRLVISGSVEEKIYHRQVFKQFLTNRILKNPRQRRFFKTQDIRDLFRLDEVGAPSDTSLIFRGSKHYRKLNATKNYFDEARVPLVSSDNLNTSNENGNDNVDDLAGFQDSSIPLNDLSQLDKEQIDSDANNEDDDDDCGASDDLLANSNLSELELDELRRKARKLSQALSRLQDKSQEVTTTTTTKASNVTVEGTLIQNVCANKEYKVPTESSSKDNSTTSTVTGGSNELVQTLVPKKIDTNGPGCSYNDVCVAKKVAEKAKKSLDQTLANVGVIDRLAHDAAIIDDITPDWRLVQRETETTARGAVDWLRGFLSVSIHGSGHEETRQFGTVKNSFLWNKDEELIFFQSIDSQFQSHFKGRDIGYGSLKKHSRFSTPFILTMIRNRSFTDKGGSLKSTIIVSNEVKSMTKNVFLFLKTRLGRTTSDDLIAHFRNQVSAGNNLLFKTIVNELCTFKRQKQSSTSSLKNGIWKLKKEFFV